MSGAVSDEARHTARWRDLARAQIQVALAPASASGLTVLVEAGPRVTGFTGVALWLVAPDGRLAQAATAGYASAERLALPEITTREMDLAALLRPEDALAAGAFRLRPHRFDAVSALTRRRAATPEYLLSVITQEDAPAALTHAWSPLDTLALPLLSGERVVGLALLDGPEAADLDAAGVALAVAWAEALTGAWRTGQNQAEARHAQRQFESGLIELTRQVQRAQAGDFTVRVPVTESVVGMIADVFNQMARQMGAIVTDLWRAFQSIEAHTGTVRDQSAILADDARAQATQIIQVSATIDAIIHSINAMAQQSATTAATAREAHAEATEGREAVEDAVRGMEGVRAAALRSSTRVKALAESIQEIEGLAAEVTARARRTNLLAVNAAIAAQHAGEAGRGFGAVVQEIRALALASAAAAQGIADRIRDIQREAAAVVQAIEESTERVVDQSDQVVTAGATLQLVDESAAHIAALNAAIAVAAQAEADKILALRVAMDAILQITTTARAGVARIAGSVADLTERAAPLREQLARFAVVPVPAASEDA